LLSIWTAADSQLISKTFGRTLKAMRPNVPEHRFVPYSDGLEPPVPQEGEIVLVCGTKPLNALQAIGVAPKNRTVNSLRETILKRGLGHYMVTFDPGIISSEPDKSQTLDWDLRLATRYKMKGSLEPVIGDYKWVSTFQPVIDFIEKRFIETGKAVDLAMDTETETFYPWYPDRDLVSLSFTVEPGSSHMLYTGPQPAPIKLSDDTPLFEQVEWLLTSPKVKLRMANGKYDLVWIAEKWGIECTNFKFDTMLVGSLLDENRSNSLNMHAKIFTDLGGYDDSFNKKFDKGKMGSINPEDLRVYAGGDTDATFQSADVLRLELLSDDALANFYITILHPAARAFEKVERRGVCVDVDKFTVLRSDLHKVIADSTRLAMEILPNKLKTKFRDKIDDQMADGKNPLVPSILKEYFFTPNGLNLKPKIVTEKTKEPSMAKSHLKMFADVPEAVKMVEALSLMDQASKTASTFVDGFLKHLRPDGRLHPTYMLFHGGLNDDEDDESGTVSGRLSAKDPAFQIIPKKTKWAKRIRECYVAPPGKAILQLDYSQGELRVVAVVAPEKNMIRAYEEGMDLHSLTGAKLAKVDYTEFLSWKESDDEKLSKLFSDIRDRAKAGNFGLLYGMGAPGFQAYAWANYGLKLTLEEAEKIRDLFFESYPGLTDYHGRMRKLVNLHEHVRSPLGRIRHLPTIRSWDREVRSTSERQAINSPIQSTLSDMMLWAIALIEDAYPNDEIAVVGMIHDALIAYVDEDKVELRAAQAQEIMSNLPFNEVGWEPTLKFPSDAEAGLNLASLKKVKKAA
jgi:DNA polymerase I-like protein with 3'-5' exonuclease and polymerase domains